MSGSSSSTACRACQERLGCNERPCALHLVIELRLRGLRVTAQTLPPATTVDRCTRTADGQIPGSGVAAAAQDPTTTRVPTAGRARREWLHSVRERPPHAGDRQRCCWVDAVFDVVHQSLCASAEAVARPFDSFCGGCAIPRPVPRLSESSPPRRNCGQRGSSSPAAFRRRHRP